MSGYALFESEFPAAGRGVIHGKMIELESPPNLQDGEIVEVRIRVVSKAPRKGEGILKTAGILGRDPEDDEILNYLQDLRKTSTHREIGERVFC